MAAGVLWNALPGFKKRKKVGDRAAPSSEARLWQSRRCPTRNRNPTVKRQSNQDEVIAMLRRPEGVTVDEVARPPGLAAEHRARALLRNPKKKLGLTLASAQEERGRVYRIPQPASA